MPYCSILRYSVARPMPSRLAASGTLPWAAQRFADQPLFPVLELQRFQFAVDRLVQAQIGDLDLWIFGQHHGAVDHVAQLAHVAGPVVGQQLFAGRLRQLQARPAMLAAEVIEKKIDQQRRCPRPARATAGARSSNTVRR